MINIKYYIQKFVSFKQQYTGLYPSYIYPVHAFNRLLIVVSWPDEETLHLPHPQVTKLCTEQFCDQGQNPSKYVPETVTAAFSMQNSNFISATCAVVVAVFARLLNAIQVVSWLVSECCFEQLNYLHASNSNTKYQKQLRDTKMLARNQASMFVQQDKLLEIQHPNLSLDEQARICPENQNTTY